MCLWKRPLDACHSMNMNLMTPACFIQQCSQIIMRGHRVTLNTHEVFIKNGRKPECVRHNVIEITCRRYFRSALMDAFIVNALMTTPLITNCTDWGLRSLLSVWVLIEPVVPRMVCVLCNEWGNLRGRHEGRNDGQTSRNEWCHIEYKCKTKIRFNYGDVKSQFISIFHLPIRNTCRKLKLFRSIFRVSMDTLK